MKHRPHTYRAAAVSEAQGLASLQASAYGAVCIIQIVQPCLGREQIADDRMMSTNVGIERSTCLVMHGPNIKACGNLLTQPVADPPMTLDSGVLST